MNRRVLANLKREGELRSWRKSDFCGILPRKDKSGGGGLVLIRSSSLLPLVVVELDLCDTVDWVVCAYRSLWSLEKWWSMNIYIYIYMARVSFLCRQQLYSINSSYE